MPFHVKGNTLGPDVIQAFLKLKRTALQVSVVSGYEPKNLCTLPVLTEPWHMAGRCRWMRWRFGPIPFGVVRLGANWELRRARPADLPGSDVDGNESELPPIPGGDVDPDLASGREQITEQDVGR